METKLYVCQYCKTEFIPKRRGVQKFCSNSCRVRSHQLKNRKPINCLVKKEDNMQSDKASVEKMSLAGVGNAAAGTLAVEALKTLFIKEENKPATKGDLKQLSKKLEQFQEILNIKKDLFG